MTTDNEGELDVSRTTGGNQSDNGLQQLNSYVTSRLSAQRKF
jgi:hypothetical protein